MKQKLLVWMWLTAVPALIAFPVRADSIPIQKDNEAQPLVAITEIPLISEIQHPLTKAEWLKQPPSIQAQSQVVQITGVKLNPTPTGVEIILETPGQQLQVSTATQDNTLIADIPNAVLALPENREFSANNPVEGITSVTVTQSDANSIQIRVTGTAVPTAQVVPSASGLVLSFNLAAEEEGLEVVVTAEKRPENVQDVPISITPITEQEIEDSDITSLDDIADNTPNFSTFTPSRNFTLYSIRGLSNFNFLSRDPVAFYVDDVPYDYTGFLTIDLPDLERVEVLRGPQGTLYGRFAQSGVVNIITRKPTNNFEFNSATSYGNYDNLDLRAGVSGPIIEDKLFFRLSGSYESRDGFLENTFLDSDVDEQSGGTGRAQLFWTPSQNWEVSFNTSFDDYHDGALPLVFFNQSDPYEIEQDFNGFSNLNSNTQSLRVAYNHPNFRFTSITARRFSDREFENEADLTTNDTITQIGEDSSTVFSQEFRLQSPEDAEEFQWFVGGYFESRDFNVDADGFRYGANAVALGFYPVTGRDRVSAEINESNFAIFTQASYQPINALTLTAGLRFETYNSTLENSDSTFIPDDGSPSSTAVSFNDIEQDGNIVLPRFVVEYRFNPNIMLYGSIARGYRPPGVNYRATNQELLTFEAEKSWNYEVGLKSSWLDERLIVNLAVFHNPVDDFQVAVPRDTGLFADIANAEASITGFEVEARATPFSGLDVIAGFGFVDAEFTNYTNPFTNQNFDGNKLAYAPDFTYNLALQYRANNGIFARLELQGLGATFFDDANRFKQGSLAVVNARLGYEFANYGIYFFANNIFDIERLVSVVPFGSFGNIASYGAPATYGIQLRSRF